MGDFDDDAAKTAAMANELRAEGFYDGPIGQETGPLPEGEPYDPQQHGTPEPPAQQDYSQHQQHQQHQPQIPNAEDDPVAHFQARTDRLEQHAFQQHQQGQLNGIMQAVKSSEEQVNTELYGDYWPAVQHLEREHIKKLERQFPNGQQTDLLAHSYGLRDARAFRDAMLQRDRVLVIDWAMRNGQDPATAYYQLAQQYGYRSPVALSRSQMNKLLDAAEKGGDTFDKAWSQYERAARRAEENRRSR